MNQYGNRIAYLRPVGFLGPAGRLVEVQRRVFAAMGQNSGLSSRHHHTYVRPLRVGWQHDGVCWTHRGVNRRRWEVMCPACGDTEGPAEDQDPVVAALRGPYSSKRKAMRIASEHCLS